MELKKTLYGIGVLIIAFILGHYMFQMTWLIVIFIAVAMGGMYYNILTQRQGFILLLIAGLGHCMIWQGYLTGDLLIAAIFLPLAILFILKTNAGTSKAK